MSHSNPVTGTMNDRGTRSEKRGDGHWLALGFWPAMSRKQSRSDRRAHDCERNQNETGPGTRGRRVTSHPGLRA